jgi:hypothetical protein
MLREIAMLIIGVVLGVALSVFVAWRILREPPIVFRGL